MTGARRPVWFIAATVALAHLSTLYWVLADRAVWPFDPAWYGEVSVTLADQLTSSGGRWLTTMTNAFGVKAPAIAWVGQFFFLLFSFTLTTEASLLLQIFLAAWFCGLAVGLATHRLTGSLVLACATPILLASFPLFAGLSVAYFVEIPQTLCALCFFSLLFFVDDHNWQWRLPLAVTALVIGLGYKVTTPIYVGAFALVELTQARAWFSRFRSRGRFSVRALVAWAAFLIVLFVVGVWYWHNAARLIDFSIRASSGDAAGLYGKTAPFFAKFQHWTLQLLLAMGITPGRRSVFAGALIAMLLVSLMVRLRQEPTHDSSQRLRRRFIFAACATILGCLALFSRQTNEESRYLAPLLPLVAILMMLALRPLVLRFGPLMGAACLILSLAFWARTNAAMFADADAHLHVWLKPIEKDGTRRQNLRALTANICRDHRGRGPVYSVIGVDDPRFNYNVMALYREADPSTAGQPCFFTGLITGDTDLERAKARFSSLDPLYYLMPSHFVPQSHDRYSPLAAPFKEWIESQPNWQHISEEPFAAYRRAR